MISDSGFASASVPRHLLRGAIGFGFIAAALVLAAKVGALALLLLPVAIFALRGCPTCWLLGLIATVSDGRVRRGCVSGSCGVTSGAARDVAEPEMTAGSYVRAAQRARWRS
jgi:hypothetical protein